jgi:hypothetical protein
MHLQAVRCSLKSNEGLLYPLDKSLFFIHKPATYIRFSVRACALVHLRLCRRHGLSFGDMLVWLHCLQDIESVHFDRAESGPGTASRTCDLVVRCRATSLKYLRASSLVWRHSLVGMWRRCASRVMLCR